MLDVIGKKWSFLIIDALGSYEKLRFNGLASQLEGISPKTLSDTLKMLEKEGLLKKELFKEIPPRVEYSLTKDGKELREAILPLLRWAIKRDGVKGKKCALECHGRPNVGKRQ